MIHTTKNCKDKVLVDARGTKIPMAYEFNDETCEVKFYLTNSNKQLVLSENRPVRCSAIVKGARLVEKD